jgi:predicted phosphodiesterase
MTVSVISDLHCHSDRLPKAFDISKLTPADVLVVAGDVATYDTRQKYTDMLKEAVADRFKNVIVINGNHDYYTTRFFMNENEFPGPMVSDNFVTSIEETADGKSRTVDFICTPLWSPIKDDRVISINLNDYNYIPGFTTIRSTQLFFENLEWLEREVKTSRNVKHDIVIVTHHLPRHELIDPMYEGDAINEAFCVINEHAENRLNALRPSLWLHGHSHNFLDMTIDGTRYIRNPIGYEYSFRTEYTGYVNDFRVNV